MDDATITFVVLGAAVALFVWNQLPVGVVALGAALALCGAGVISVDEAFAGFGDPTVIFIASLFIVSEALDTTGVTTWAGQRLVAAAGSSDARLVIYVLLLAAGLSAILTPNGAVAALLPMTVLVAMRLGRAPSKLLMPMAFAAHAGALLVLTGSPVNVLVADEAGRLGVGRFGYFEFALVGVPLTIGAVVIGVLLGPRLLSVREPHAMSVDLSGHARTLMRQYLADGGAVVRHEAPETLFTRRSGASRRSSCRRGPRWSARRSSWDGYAERRPAGACHPATRSRHRPTARRAGRGRRAAAGGLVEALDEHLGDDQVLVVDPPEAIRRQTVPPSAGARRAMVIVAAMVAALATGVMPAAVAGALAAMAMVVLGVLRTEEAYRAVSWTAVVLIAGLIPVSTALQDTGAADKIASVLLDVVGDAGPHAVLIGLFVVAAVFSVAVSNTATALILIPVAVSAADTLDISARPVLMSVAVGCSAAFLTPISTPGNLMIMGPAGYRFGDYWRFGLPLLGLFFVVAVVWVPVVWRF